MGRVKALAALGIALALLAGACSGDEDVAPNGDVASVDDVIRIGVITDLTGRFVSFGRDIKVASELAVAEINEAGGVNGARLVVDIFDSGGDQGEAVIGFRSLADNDVVAVSGPVSSGEAEVLFPQAAETMLPIITGTANAEGITELGEGWAFRNTASNLALYREALPRWAAKYGIETAVLVYDEAEIVAIQAAEEAVPAVAEESGVELVNLATPITFTKGQTDFSTTVQRIREADGDGLIILSAPAEAGLLARELARRGETRPVLGHPAQAGNSFFSQGQSDINNWVLPSILNLVPDDERTQAYVVAIDAVDEEPPTVPEAVNYYDNIYLFAEVIRAAGIDASTDVDVARVAIRDGLASIVDFPGVASPITFDDVGDASKVVFVNVVINGAVEPLD